MDIFVNKIAVFRPSEDNPGESPKLEFVDALFKRRLSQISKMTIQVVHDVLDCAANAPLVFSSFRGEIARQLKINKGLVEDFEVMPAQFSISVFNTPPAVATIALKIKNGYTVIYPSENDFSAALISAASPILCGREDNVVFAFADELIPSEYKECLGYDSESKPLAFACVLSSSKKENSVELKDFNFSTPEEFVEKIKF